MLALIKWVNNKLGFLISISCDKLLLVDIMSWCHCLYCISLCEFVPSTLFVKLPPRGGGGLQPEGLHSSHISLQKCEENRFSSRLVDRFRLKHCFACLGEVGTFSRALWLIYPRHGTSVSVKIGQYCSSYNNNILVCFYARHAQCGDVGTLDTSPAACNVTSNMSLTRTQHFAATYFNVSFTLLQSASLSGKFSIHKCQFSDWKFFVSGEILTACVFWVGKL